MEKIEQANWLQVLQTSVQKSLFLLEHLILFGNGGFQLMPNARY